MSDQRNDVMRVLGDLIGFPTVTQGPNLELIDYAANLLEGHAGQVSVVFDATAQKANLFATIGPLVDGGVVLSGHTDVVPAEGDDWTVAPFLATRRQDRIYGRGAADMKGFIACMVVAASTLAAMPLRRPVHLALTFDEEIGCHGARLLLDVIGRTGPRPSAAIVGEPTMMRVIMAHKGCYEYTTTVTGREGHASAPAAGVNAVEYAVRLVGRLQELHRELVEVAPPGSPFTPPHTTVSVGTIAGGTARNILARECTFEWEIRPVRRHDADRVHKEMATFSALLEAEMRRVDPDTGIVTVTAGEVDGLEPAPGSATLDLMHHLLDDVQLDVASYGTEAGLYARAGIPAVVCGPGSITVAHQPDEYVAVHQLTACLDMIERLGIHLSDDGDRN